MGFYNFRKDLQASHPSVFRVIEALSEKGCEVKGTNDTIDYDIEFLKDGQTHYVEVKEDLMASKTGNVAIEYMSRNKPSGILASKANIWSYLINDKIYFVLRSKILSLINSGKYRIVNGGDNKTSQLFLVPVKDFLSICTL